MIDDSKDSGDANTKNEDGANPEEIPLPQELNEFLVEY